MNKVKIRNMRKYIKYATLYHKSKIRFELLSKVIYHIKTAISPIYADFYKAKNDMEKYGIIVENIKRNGR